MKTMIRTTIGHDIELHSNDLKVDHIGNDCSVKCEYDGGFYSIHPKECVEDFVYWLASKIKEYNIKHLIGGAYIDHSYVLGGHIHFGKMINKIDADIDRNFLDLVLLYTLASVQDLKGIQQRCDESSYGQLSSRYGSHQQRENNSEFGTFEYRSLSSPESIEMIGPYFGLSSFVGRILYNKIVLENTEAKTIVKKITRLFTPSTIHFLGSTQTELMRIASNVICRIRPYLEPDEMQLISPLFRLLKNKKTVKKENYVENRIIKQKLCCVEYKKEILWSSDTHIIESPTSGIKLTGDTINEMVNILIDNGNLTSNQSYIYHVIQQSSKIWFMRSINHVDHFVGFIVLKGRGELGYFTITPQLRGMGFGTILLSTVINSDIIPDTFMRCIEDSITDQIMRRISCWKRKNTIESKVYLGKKIIEYWNV